MMRETATEFADSHNCDDCLKYSEGDSEDSCFDRNYSDQEPFGGSEKGYPNMFPVYDIKANGPLVNIFSDEEFVNSDAEADVESVVKDDFTRITDMFYTLVNFVRNVEQYVKEESQMNKEEMSWEIDFMKNMLKQNAECFFDMADFVASKHATKIDSCETGKSSLDRASNNDKAVDSNNAADVEAKINNSKVPVEPKEAADKRRASSRSLNKSKKSPTSNNTSKSKTSAKKQKKRSSEQSNKSSGGGCRKRKNSEDLMTYERRKSSRIPVKRKIYYNGMRVCLDNTGNLLVPSLPEATGGSDKENVRKSPRRKTIASLKPNTTMGHPSKSQSERGASSVASRAGRKSLPAKSRRSMPSQTVDTTASTSQLDANKSLPNKSRRSLFSMDSWMHSLNEVGMDMLT